MNKIYHDKLEHIELMVSFQRVVEGVDQPKFVALAKSYKSIDSEGRLRFSYRSSGNLVPHYYLLWASHDDFTKAGYTLLRTKSGRAVTLNSALKTFREAIAATEFVAFK